jgi:hypothetical protein
MDGAPRWLALLGVAVGFVALVVPGVYALRSYRRWREGVRLQPSTAWVFGVLGGWLLVIAAIVLFTDLLGLAVLVTLVGPPASIVLALRS